MFRILLLLSGVSLKISGGFVAAAIIGLVVSSLRPLASPACTHSFRDAASMGSGQLSVIVAGELPWNRLNGFLPPLPSISFQEKRFYVAREAWLDLPRVHIGGES